MLNRCSELKYASCLLLQKQPPLCQMREALVFILDMHILFVLEVCSAVCQFLLTSLPFVLVDQLLTRSVLV